MHTGAQIFLGGCGESGDCAVGGVIRYPNADCGSLAKSLWMQLDLNVEYGVGVPHGRPKPIDWRQKGV